MRSKSIILLALALGCGLVASIGISQYMDASSTDAKAGERQPVFVAMADINANDELTAQNIKLEEWPKSIIPAGALVRLEDVEGRRSRTKIYAGEPILSSKLLGENESIGAAQDIPTGYRVAHVTVDGASGSSNLILPGDRVDVLVFRNVSSTDLSATASKIVLQDIKVFAVNTFTETEFSKNKSEQTEPMTARTISLLVTPRQAEILHAATEMSGAIRLVLRNPEDDAHYASEGATIGDIFGPGERTNRNGERTSADEDDGLADWLESQKGNPPAQPPVPPQPIAPPARMIVMYGAEVTQIEIPADGSPPYNPFQRDSYSPGGSAPSFAPPTPIPGGSAPEFIEDAHDSGDEVPVDQGPSVGF